MADSARPTALRGAGARRRTPVPGRGKLLGAVAMVVFGSFMPWLDTLAGQVSGAGGAGLWTFYAAMLGLAGALVPIHVLRVVQASILAVVAIALPVWQVIHMLRLVGTSGWLPGPGLVLVLGGGVLAAVAVRQLATAPREA
jgi:hypothetical protein